MKKIIFILPLFFQILFAQSKGDVTLFTVDNESVSLEEFERVYTKNNINNQADYSKASLDEYLDLFVKFKLKVKEAENLKMDTIPSIKSELAMYQKQLIKNYANDKEVSEELVKEAYNRSKVEVDASHILILWNSDYPSKEDSLKALNTINAIKKTATPANFNALAQTKSQDPSAKDNLGRLGFLTVFQTVYPFENALYNTKPGTISDPIATQFGYHLVYVHESRPARGKMTTAHLLIKSKEGDDAEKKAGAKLKAQIIYDELMLGTIDFESAVKQYSEDNKTKNQAGKLPQLSSSEMIASYADAAFSLKKDGDFSAPISTSIGWHIIKRVSKSENPSFEEAEKELNNRVSRDSRSNVALQRTVEDTKNQFGYSFNKEAYEEVVTLLTEKYSGKPNKVEPSSYNKTVFTIGEKAYLQQNYIAYANSNFTKNSKKGSVESLLRIAFAKYQNAEIQKYREDHLAEINVDYKNLMQEYHDGILLFELTDKEVWSKAVKDTTGLKEFHKINEKNYMWKERLAYTKYTFKNDKAAILGKKLLSKGKSNDQIVAKINKKEDLLSYKKMKSEKENLDVDGLKWEKGSSVTLNTDNGEIEYYLVNEILSPEVKKLDETRGYVISDYQNFLEKEWIENLRSKYKVVLNEDLFQSLIKK